MKFGTSLVAAVLFLSVGRVHAQDSLFAPTVNYGAGVGPYSVFLADLDGDNDNDLVVANRSSDNVSILLNNSDGTFASALATVLFDLEVYSLLKTSAGLVKGDRAGQQREILFAANEDTGLVALQHRHSGIGSNGRFALVHKSVQLGAKGTNSVTRQNVPTLTACRILSDQ